MSAPLSIISARVRQSPAAARHSAWPLPKGGVAADEPGIETAEIRQPGVAGNRRGTGGMHPARAFVGRGGSACAVCARRGLPKSGACS